MSEKRKPSLWDRLLGRQAPPQDTPQAPEDTPQGLEEAPGASDETMGEADQRAPGPVLPEEPITADPEEPAPEEAFEPDEAGPPETRAEWVEAGHPDAPEPDRDTPETIHDPFDAEPENLEGATQEEQRPEPMEAPDLAPGPAPIPEHARDTGIITYGDAGRREDAPPSPQSPEPEAPEPEAKRSWWQRLSQGLRRSSDNLSTSISSVFTKRRLDEDQLQDLEDILIQADLGIDTAVTITDRLRAEKFDKDVSQEEIQAVLAEEVEAVLAPVAQPLALDTTAAPFVILMVGVNGSGKTTTIGKLTAKYRAEGHSVLLAAGDTFRAAAVEQLQIWGERTETEVVTRPTGADAAGLAFDAVTQAKESGTDVVIIDTAGRLQNRAELMDELEKVIRVIKKVVPDAPHATLLTLDATTGQNALNQVEIFGQKAGVTGLVMTKLDGTARGGILVAIAKTFGLPIHFIGVGEAVGDLEPFKARDFARAMIGHTGKE